MSNSTLIIILLILLAIVVGALTLNQSSRPHELAATRHHKPKEIIMPDLSKTDLIDLAWDSFKEVKVDAAEYRPIDLVLPEHLQYENVYRAVVLPGELREALGKRVRLSGIVFLNQSGIKNDRIHQFALLPPYSVACNHCAEADSRMEWTIFVDSSAKPWALPDQDPLIATVEGVLGVKDDNFLGCALTMRDADVSDLKPLEEINEFAPQHRHEHQ